MQEFSKQMEESGGEAKLKNISLAISILAVLVAMVTVLGHRSHTRAILMQSRAGDQWNQYQAKKNRQEDLSVTVATLPLQPTADAKRTATLLAEYQAQIAKWKNDEKAEQEAAEGFEREVERAESQAEHFDLGEALLQISVVFSSITLFTRRRRYFIGGLVMGLIGVVVAASAWTVR